MNRGRPPTVIDDCTLAEVPDCLRRGTRAIESAMVYPLLADIVVLVHLAFVAFVVLGAGLVWRFARLAWLHLAAVTWAVFVETTGHVCPLTPLENSLRRASGEAGYSGGFVEHYLLPLLYPEDLTRGLQVALGLAIVLVNLFAYALIWRRARRRRSRP